MLTESLTFVLSASSTSTEQMVDITSFDLSSVGIVKYLLLNLILDSLKICLTSLALPNVSSRFL